MYDIFIVVFLIIFLIVGQKRGLVRSIYSMLSIVLSVLLVYLLKDVFISAVAESPMGEAIGDFFVENTNSELSEQFSFAVVSIVSMIALYFLSKFILRAIIGVLDFIAKLPVLNSLNCFFGAVFGLVSGGVWIFVITNIAYLFPKLQTYIDDSSIVAIVGLLLK